MQRKFTFSFFILLCFFALHSNAQTQDRINLIQSELEQLSLTVPGLNQQVQLSVNGVSIQEFLSALSKSNNLSINIDQRLNIKVTNNFNNVTALNILVFLAKNYSLDISFTGSIITISPYTDPSLNLHPVKEIKVRYSQTDNTISLELDNDSLYAVARKITRLSGKNLVVTPALMTKKVTAFIAGAPFETAIEKLAYANDFKMVKTSDNFYLLQSLGEGEELYVNGDRNTAVRKTFKPAATGTGGNAGVYSKTVPGGQKLISVDATNANIQDLVKSASQEMGKSYFLYSEIKGTITSHVNDITYDNFLSSMFQGTDYTFRLENGIYLIGDRKLEGLRAHRVIQLQNRSIDTIQAMIPTEWRKGVEIREFKEQNTLLLSGSGPQITEIEEFIKQIDKLVPMVLIEVTLLDVRKTRTVTTGISIGTSDSVKTGGTILPGFDYTFSTRSINSFLNGISKITSINIGQVTPTFYARLSALEANNNVNVRSVPKLSTLNGHSATLSIGSTRYYAIRTQNVIPSLTNPTNIFTQQFNKTEANLAINIRPVVSGNDQVTLNIKVEISDFIGNPPDNAPAPTSTSKFESIVRAHNEDMIILGGIERTEGTEVTSGTPILSRIPILKWIFSNRSKTTGKVITVVFIKPTIIH
jgi:type IV pilus assembly protein PilQ